MAHSQQTNVELFGRTEEDVKRLRAAIQWAEDSRALTDSGKRLVAETKTTAAELNSVELTEAWLQDIVDNHTAADQVRIFLIQVPESEPSSKARRSLH